MITTNAKKSAKGKDKNNPELSINEISTWGKYLDCADFIQVIIDKDGNIVAHNQKAMDIIKGHYKSAVGHNWFKTFLPLDSEKIQSEFERIKSVDSNKSITFESSTDISRIIHWTIVALDYTSNDNANFLILGKDISVYKENEQKLIDDNFHLQSLLAKAPLGYQVLDTNGKIMDINKTWTSLLGYSKDSVVGTSFQDLIPIEYQDIFSKNFTSLKEKGKLHAEFPVTHIDGSTRYISFDGTINVDDYNNIQAYCTLNDVTKQHRIQTQIKESEENFKLAQSIAKIGSWELDIGNDFLWISEEAKKIFGIDRPSNSLKLSEINKMMNREDQLSYQSALNNLIAKNIPYDITFKIHAWDNKLKYINSKASLFTNSDDVHHKIIGVIRDISEERNKQVELEYLNIHDYLTDLYNRPYYFEQFKHLDHKEFYPLGIMIMDVNGLKIINDAFGHAVGDKALKIIGKILKDVFTKNDVIARVGGDEFAALLPKTTPDKMQMYKEKINDLVRKQKIKNIELSLAIGYEIKNNPIEDVDELQRLAENRMFKHKTSIGSSTRSKAIGAILKTLTNKYADEKKHSYQVSNLCKQIGRALNLKADDLNELGQAGLFHDIGKISIPDEILKKPGRLTDAEFEVIKSHTEVGYQILRAADEYSDLAIYALHHHEKWDGSGYPGKLKGNDIPLYSRIITVVDAFEAMTADRPYRKRLSKKEAISEIVRCSGTQFDPSIAKVFVEKVLHETWTDS